MLEARLVNGVRVAPDGASLPAHVQAAKIPPAWTDVRYHPDPASPIIAQGRDAKGRLQSVYSAAHHSGAAETKWARIDALRSEYAAIEAENDAARLRSQTRDVADAHHLIMRMGIRPGSDSDTKAKIKAYGATTLEGRHIVPTDDGLRLQFTGKKGVAIDLPVEDDGLAAMLRQRADAAGPSGRLFGEVNDARLRDHVHSLGSGGFTPKDFRTHHGTMSALDLVAGMPAPTDEKSYRRSVMSVAKAVSAKLGNTPSVALQSYINPAAFAPWKEFAPKPEGQAQPMPAPLPQVRGIHSASASA